MIFAYLFCAATLGSLLAWLLHDLIDFSYEKTLSRGVLLFAALGLVPMWRLAGLNRHSVGWVPVQPGHVLHAYPVGIAMVVPLMVFFLVVEFRVIDPRLVFMSFDFFSMIMVVFVSGLLVGIFEETLFRGVLFGVLRRGMGFVGTSIFVGLLYAAVHFLNDDETLVTQVSWYSGYQQVLAAFTGLASPAGYYDAFIALFMLGVLFCWVRERFGLWWCIGLHGAWVFSIRFFKEITVRDVLSPYQIWVSDYDNFVGHLVSLWLLFLLVLLLLYRKHKANLNGSDDKAAPA